MHTSECMCHNEQVKMEQSHVISLAELQIFRATFSSTYVDKYIFLFNPWHDLGTIDCQFNVGVNLYNNLGAIVLKKSIIFNEKIQLCSDNYFLNILSKPFSVQ